MNRRAFLLQSGVAAVVAPAVLRRRDAEALDPAVCGAWEPRVVQPHIPIHTSQIPGTHLVLCIFGKGLHPAPLAWVYDPFAHTFLNDTPYDAVTNPVAYHSVPFEYNPMCGGAFIDARGTTRYYGGTIVGSNRSARFTLGPTGPASWSWGPWLSGKLNGYYPTALRTGVLPGYPSGAGLVAFGRRAYIDIYDLHDYNPDLVMGRLPASANVAAYAGPSQNYVRLFLRQDGTLALVGTEAEIRVLDIPTGTWTHRATMHGRRYDGCATQLEDADGDVFLLSAGDEAWPKHHQERVNVATGELHEIGPTQVDRYQATTVVLPDGHIFQAGGTATVNACNPEIWNRVTGVSTLLAPTLGGPTQTRRAYHSVATLLIDGSILWGGGNPASLCKTFERFLPPYLFQGPRPDFQVVDVGPLAYGGLAAFTSADAATVDQVVLVRPGVSSHGCNFEQKRIPLTFTRVSAALQAVMPTNTNLAPPGWYMAFALRGGVPSLGQWVRLALP